MTDEEKEIAYRINCRLLAFAAILFIVLFFERITSFGYCDPVTDYESYNWLTNVCSDDVTKASRTFKDVEQYTPVHDYINEPERKFWYNVEVDKSFNPDGSYDVTVTALMKGLILPDWITFTKTTRKMLFHVRPTEDCIDLVVNDEGTGLRCVSIAKPTAQIEAVKKQVAETEKKSELKSTAPKDICLDNYLGAKYKDGKCEFPVYERMNGRAGLENKFDSCQINKIIAGKGNTATAHAVCRGVPSIIHVKRYYQKAH